MLGSGCTSVHRIDSRQDTQGARGTRESKADFSEIERYADHHRRPAVILRPMTAEYELENRCNPCSMWSQATKQLTRRQLASADNISLCCSIFDFPSSLHRFDSALTTHNRQTPAERFSLQLTPGSNWLCKHTINCKQLYHFLAPVRVLPRTPSYPVWLQETILSLAVLQYSDKLSSERKGPFADNTTGSAVNITFACPNCAGSLMPGL